MMWTIFKEENDDIMATTWTFSGCITQTTSLTKIFI